MCEGAFYSDEFGKWDSVVVQGIVQISLNILKGTLDNHSDKIHLSNGLSCPLVPTDCDDDLTGEYFWDDIPNDACQSPNHNVLYEGVANITVPGYNNNDSIFNTNTILTVNSQDMLFSLQLTGVHELCNLQSYKTEHPRLIIIRKTGFASYLKRLNPNQLI